MLPLHGLLPTVFFVVVVVVVVIFFFFFFFFFVSFFILLNSLSPTLSLYSSSFLK